MELEQFFTSISDFFGFIAKKIEGGITSLFGSSNERLLKKLEARVEAINRLESKYQGDGNGKAKSISKPSKSSGMQLSFFQLDDPVLCQVRDEILGIDVNNLTPLEALNKLNEIKKIVRGK